MRRLPFAVLAVGLAALPSTAEPQVAGGEPDRLEREIIQVPEKVDLEREELGRAFRLARLGDLPALVTTGQDALPSTRDLDVRILVLDGDTLKEHPLSKGLPPLPSGPLPSAVLLEDGRLLLATSRHLVFSDGSTIENVPAPWEPGDRSAELRRSGKLTWILSPDGRLFTLGERDRIQPYFSSETPRTKFFVIHEREEVLWWIDEHDRLHRERLGERGPHRESSSLSLPNLDEDPIRALDATPDTAFAISRSGRLWIVRDGRIHYDSGERNWPALAPVALRVLGEGQIEIAERTGWIVRLTFRDTTRPFERILEDEGSRLWDLYRDELLWLDRVVPGWNVTFEACAFGADGWFLRRDRACLLVEPKRIVEVRSDPLPYGLAADPIQGQALPFIRLPRILSPMLPRTIRAVQAGEEGVWITTSFSLDLVDTRSWRIVERFSFPEPFREEIWNRLAFLPPEGALVHEVPRENRLPETTLFLRTPEDRRILRHRFPRDPTDVLEGKFETRTDTFHPGDDLPAPPFRGFALDARGDLAVGTRRGLYVLRRDEATFRELEGPGGRRAATIQDVQGIPGQNAFAVLIDGRALRFDVETGQLEPLAQRSDLIGLWSDGERHVSATNGHELLTLEGGEAVPWPCEPTPVDREVRAFGKSGDEMLALDRENHLLHWSGEEWREIPLEPHVSAWSGISLATNDKLVLNLEASCWQLDGDSRAHFVLDYRQGLAAQVERYGLQNVMFVLFAIAMSTFLFCATGVVMLDKGPLPKAPPLLAEPLLLHVFLLPLIYKFGMLACMGVTSQTELSAYPVWAAFFQTIAASWFTIWLARRVLERRYLAGFEHVGLMPIRFPLLLSQFLLGVLALIPVRFLSIGLATLFSADTAGPTGLAPKAFTLVPHDLTERFVLFVTIAILPALVEEVLFRGLMQTFLVQRFGPATGILLTALFFTSLHDVIAAPDEILLATLPIFVLGVVLSALRHVSGNLYICFGLHLAHNAVTGAILALSS